MSSYNRQATRLLHTNSVQWRAIRKQVLDRSSKTAQEQRGGVATIKGHDINGDPLDPNHAWNREKSPAS